MHTNYRLFVLTESDALILILSAGQHRRARFKRCPYRACRRALPGRTRRGAGTASPKTRCAGGGEPAHVRADLGEDGLRGAWPDAGLSSSRATVGRTTASGPVPACGPVVPSGSTPCAAGMASIRVSILVVRVSIWPVRASIWSSSIRASSAW